MKLVMAIINDEDVYQIMDLINENGFSATKLASTGGFLRSGNTTLICGTEEEKVPLLLECIEKVCKSRKQIATVSPANMGSSKGYIPFPVEITVGGATIFVLDVDQFKKI